MSAYSIAVAPSSSVAMRVRSSASVGRNVDFLGDFFDDFFDMGVPVRPPGTHSSVVKCEISGMSAGGIG